MQSEENKAVPKAELCGMAVQGHPEFFSKKTRLSDEHSAHKVLVFTQPVRKILYASGFEGAYKVNARLW